MKAFNHFLQSNFPNHQYGTWLLAISGGKDSVVLAHLLHRHHVPFEMAHCNYGLRGKESDEDEQFVVSLAAEYNVRLHRKCFDLSAIASTKSIQAEARRLRYEWFESVREANQLSYLVTAHHADDNIETMVFNFFRGTGLRGLAGMAPVQLHVARPLIFVTREEIDAYADEHNLQWRIDQSNFKDDYTRNYIRLQIIPGMEKHLPNLRKRLFQNQQRFAEAEQLYQQALQAQLKKLQFPKGDELHIPILLLRKKEPLLTLVWEMLKPFGFSTAQCDRAVQQLWNDELPPTCELDRSATYRLLKNRAWWVVAPIRQAEEEAIILLHPNDLQVVFAGGLLLQKAIDHAGPAQRTAPSNEALLDSALVEYPLVLRRWRTGDYFYPLGLGKKKKVSRFLIDLKLSKTEKEQVWVLESNKKLIWLVGFRIDDRFKITDRTQSVLQVVWEAQK